MLAFGGAGKGGFEWSGSELDELTKLLHDWLSRR